MKTQELFELRKSKQVTRVRYTVQDESGEWKYVPGGVEYQTTNYYKPGFKALKRSPDVGDIFGTIGDWLDEMGATKADIAPAREEAVNSPEYKKLISMGFKDVSSPGEVKAGTITLEVMVKARDGKRERLAKMRRSVHINGNVRTFSNAWPSNTNPNAEVDLRRAGRGRTYHPMTVKSHPDMTGKDRLVASMRASMKRLADLYRKPLLKTALDKMVDI